MCSYLRVTLSSVDNLHVRNTLYYLVARSRGILATGAICFDIRLAKTPHNIPATYDEFDWVPSRLLAIMRRSTNKNADFSGEKVPGYIQDWSKALPSPSPHWYQGPSNFHQLRDSGPSDQFTELFMLFSFHCWGKLGKSSMLPDTSSSPDVPPCTPIMVKPSRLKTMHDNSPTDSSTINHYLSHISDEVGQLCITTPVLDNVASHSQCFWSVCQPSPPLPPPLLDQSSCCVDLQEAPDTVQVKGWQLIPWQKTPMARQKREKKAGPVLLLCGFAGGTWYPANQGLTKLATINSVTIG